MTSKTSIFYIAIAIIYSEFEWQVMLGLPVTDDQSALFAFALGFFLLYYKYSS